MKKKSYYLDSCIWLNVINRENRLSISSRNFIEELIKNEDEIFHSELVLEEIMNQILPYEYSNLLEINRSDFDLANKLSKISQTNIGQKDFLHIAICLKRDLILVTRDKKLYEVARLFIKTRKLT